MDYSFCRRCGEPLTPHEPRAYSCPQGHKVYQNPAPAAGAFFVSADQKVMLAERGIDPHKGMLDAFGGFVENFETLEQAVERELEEELSLKAHEYEELTYLSSSVGRYPYGGEVEPILTNLFWTRLTTNRQLTPSDDVAAVHWLPIHDIDMNLLHDDDIRDGIKALQKQFPATNKE